MTTGLVAKRALSEIGNAIRAKNGLGASYAPGEMADAVAALDGSATSAGAQFSLGSGAGVVERSTMAAIAEAIRAQNGEATTYRPQDMAAAILALEWEAEPVPRAVFLEDGTLEFNCFGSVKSATGGTVVSYYEVATGDYASSSRPWSGIKAKVKRAVFDASFAQSGVTSLYYLFSGFSNMTEVRGFENLAGITNMSYMFSSCGSLQSIYGTGFDSSAVEACSGMFFGAYGVVGGTGSVLPSVVDASVFELGDGGILTDPDDDARTWAWGTVYSDGALEVSASEVVDAAREVLYHGRACREAAYTSTSAIPWLSGSSKVTSIEVLADMAALPTRSVGRWFTGMGSAASCAGMGNLSGVENMLATFSGCKALTELDLRGFDPSALVNVESLFYYCSALTTILADASWELPATVTKGSPFVGATALVGGNGTKYASGRTGYKYLVVDTAATPGYLTAG